MSESRRPDTRRSSAPAGAPNDAALNAVRYSDALSRGMSAIHRLLVDSVREYAIFALDPEGRILTWNAGAERFKGWTAEEIVGIHFSVFYPPEEAASGKPDAMLRAAARHGSVADQGWRMRKDGTRFWADVVITALRDGEGKLVGYGKITRDLTDQHDAEARLRESEARFRLLVHSVRDYAIFMLDPEGRVATWNEGAERIKGYSADEIVGAHLSTFYPADVVETGFPWRMLERAARDGRIADEGWRVRKDGSLFWASVVITALREESGELVGFAKVTRDLTERRQAQERAIRDARRVAEMEATNRTRNEFLTMLSHELRTPLNAIGGYADLLEMEVTAPVTDSQRQFVRRIKKSQQHLLGLVNDLLNLSRVESGQVEYDHGPILLEELLGDLEAMILPQAREKGIEFEVVHCPPDATAWADSARTQQILLNLLSNAAKFTPNGGRITVSCSVTPDRVGISVIDTGPGIAEEQQEAIFEPFMQVGRSLTNTREGIGLGLAISRDLARGMGGDLKVSSELGEGSTFTLILPRSHE